MASLLVPTIVLVEVCRRVMQQHGATIWTMDADFDGLPNVRYVAKRT